jgi:hypothetical protein
MHKTESGEKAKTLKKEAGKLAKDATAARRAAKILPEAREKVRELEGQADSLQAEAEALKEAARLEDLHVWAMGKVKTTKKGSRTYHYWMANWREGSKVHNVHLGSCRKMSQADALEKAREMKKEALGVRL